MCPEEKPSGSETITKPARFVDGENATVIEHSKRLIWMKDDTFQLTAKWMSWIQVRDYAKELNEQRYAGYGNWRMPTTAEVRSLYDKNNRIRITGGRKFLLMRYSIPDSGFCAGPVR